LLLADERGDPKTNTEHKDPLVQGVAALHFGSLVASPLCTRLLDMELFQHVVFVFRLRLRRSEERGGAIAVVLTWRRECCPEFHIAVDEHSLAVSNNISIRSGRVSNSVGRDVGVVQEAMRARGSEFKSTLT
jgi:hypothetical protein